MPAANPSGPGVWRPKPAPRKRPAPRPRPPVRSTPTQRARAQEQSYASQGRAVERQANRQKAAAPRPPHFTPQTPAPAFRPIPRQAQPFGVQQSRARHQVRHARRALPEHPAIPNIPVKTSYTPDEIHSIREAYKAGARKIGGTSIMDLYRVGNLSQRRKMKLIGRRVQIAEEAANYEREAAGGVPRGRDQVGPRVPEKATMGFIPPGVDDFLKEHSRIPNTGNASLSDIAGIPWNIARATVEDPGAVARSSVRTAVESVAGIPQGVKTIVETVEKEGLRKGLGKSLDAIAKDYEQRYGPIFSDPARFRRQIQQDYGLTPFVLDAASLGVPVGRAATVLARSGAAGRAAAALADVAEGSRAARPLAHFAETAHRAARAPRDAKRLAGLRDRLHMAELEGDVEQASTLRKQIKDAEANVRATERPALRFSGGEGGVRKQESSPNLLVGLGQRGLDRSRRVAQEGRVAAAGLDEGPGGRMLTVRGRKVKPLSALRPGTNEVVPKTSGVFGRSLRELPVARRYTGRVARDLGGQQSVTRMRLLTHRGRVLNRITKTLKPLDENEQAGLKYMLQLGATPDQAGIDILRARRTQIETGRAAHGIEEIAPILADTNDELTLINRILDAPADYLTPRARRAADDLRAIQREEESRDPELTRDQALIRTTTPQAAALGVERAPDADFFRGVMNDIEGRSETPGVASYMDPLATMRPADRAAAAKALVKPIRKQRKRAERDVETARRRLTAIDARIKQAEKRGVPIDDDTVREARAALRGAKSARDSIQRQLPRAAGRTGRILGRLSHQERKGPPVLTPQVRAARRAVSEADRQLGRLQRELAAAEEKASRLQGVTEGRFRAGGMTAGAGRAAADQADHVAELQHAVNQATEASRLARSNLRDVERLAPRLTPEEFTSRVDAARVPEDLRAQLEDAEQAVIDARGTLKEALASAPRATERQLEARAVRERELAASRATREHIRAFEKAIKQVQRAAKQKWTMRLEDADSFANRVGAIAEDAGLEAPAYWMSAMRPRELPSLAAAGRGVRAAHANKRYKGTLFEIGAEQHDVGVYTQGIERNIKRRFQQALVARNLETHAYEWSRGHGGEGMTVAQIERELIDRAIDPKSVELVAPRVTKARATEAAGVERGAVASSEDVQGLRDAFGVTDEDFISTSQQDLAEGRRTIEEAVREDMRHQGHSRYLAVPREVGETLDGLANNMDNTFWRSIEILLKQKPARILLGAANIPWLSFQIASNALLTGLGGGLNPFNVHGAHKWWRGLTPDEKEAVEAELGITHGHHFGLDEPSLGATNNRMVSFWRAYKKTKTGRLAHRMNPLDAMFRVDEKQNNFFRRVLFYDASRKAAYRRMGASWKGIDQSTTTLMDRVLARPPQRQASLIAKHGAEFEKVAKHVNDFLGDYLRFTPAERFVFQRNVMFYGYLRFSLRFAFYTMPVGHPVMANIMSQVGRMGAQEIKDLMGVPNDYRLPTSILAQTYFGDRADAKRGDLKALPLGRFNPFLNSLTQLDGMQQALGLVSPLYQALADQAFQESSFTGQDWRIGGRPTPSQSDRPKNYFGSSWDLLNPLAYDVPGHAGKPRNRILEGAAADLFFPYRLATKTGVPGVADPLAANQSDDALLWRPQPMQYADPKARKGVNRSRRELTDRPLTTKLVGGLFPVVPTRTAAPAVVTREREREAAIRERNKHKPGYRKPRKKKAGSRYGAGGGGGGGGRYG